MLRKQAEELLESLTQEQGEEQFGMDPESEAALLAGIDADFAAG